MPEPKVEGRSPSCKLRQEGSVPATSCTLCRRADCEIWQELIGESGSENPGRQVVDPPGNGTATRLGTTLAGPIEIPLDELLKDVRRTSHSP